MTNEQFNTLPFGFTDIYGIKWDDSQVDLYNKVSEEIQHREIDGFLVSEEMLCNRHRIYQIPLYNRRKGEVDDKKCRRRTVHIEFNNGNRLETVINGTKEEVRNYYLNNRFNVGGEPLTTGKAVIFLQ